MIKAAEEKRRRELQKLREEMTLRNTKKRHHAIMKHHFQILKKFYVQQKNLRRLINALKVKPYSKPMQGFRKVMKSTREDKLPDYYHKPVDVFTDIVRNHVAKKIYNYENNSKKLQSKNIHYRITCFFTKPRDDSRSGSIFNDWIIKTITNESKSLMSVTNR